MTDPLDDRTEPRAAASGRAAIGDPTAAVSHDPIITDEGSTVIARRESRRRQDRAASSAAASRDEGPATVAVPTASARSARPPDVGSTGSPLRGPEPVVVPRIAPRRGIPQTVVDAAAEDAARRRRSRARAAVVAGVCALLVVAAATALIFLLTMG